MTPARLAWLAIGHALTGQHLDPPEAASWQAAEVLAWLAGQGWGDSALVAHREQVRDSHAQWPHRLPSDVLDGLAHAQYTALLAQVRRLAGLDGLHPTVHSGPRVIGPQERRLLAEVPPHHVAR